MVVFSALVVHILAPKDVEIDITLGPQEIGGTAADTLQRLATKPVDNTLPAIRMMEESWNKVSMIVRRFTDPVTALEKGLVGRIDDKTWENRSGEQVDDSDRQNEKTK